MTDLSIEKRQWANSGHTNTHRHIDRQGFQDEQIVRAGSCSCFRANDEKRDSCSFQLFMCPCSHLVIVSSSHHHLSSLRSPVVHLFHPQLVIPFKRQLTAVMRLVGPCFRNVWRYPTTPWARPWSFGQNLHTHTRIFFYYRGKREEAGNQTNQHGTTPNYMLKKTYESRRNGEFAKFAKRENVD